MKKRSWKRSWRDGSEVKSSGCSSRGPEFNSKQPHGGSQPCIMRSGVLFWQAGTHGGRTVYIINEYILKKTQKARNHVSVQDVLPLHVCDTLGNIFALSECKGIERVAEGSYSPDKWEKKTGKLGIYSAPTVCLASISSLACIDQAVAMKVGGSQPRAPI